jgi:hypothetical protein
MLRDTSAPALRNFAALFALRKNPVDGATGWSRITSSVMV